MKPKITIIIPVYNAEKYIKDCLLSITNQIFKNIEVICINDGSTDNSLAILNNYAKVDERIKVFSQKNQGPAKARNVGLENASGEFIMFCDADDTYNADMCATLIKGIQKSGSDLAMCNTNGYDKKGKE